MEAPRMRSVGMAFGAVVMGVIAWALATQRLSWGALLVGAAIAALAVLVNGLVAMIEDDLPGGFNNPDGRNTPSYLAVLGKISHAFVAIALAAVAVLLLALANEAGWATINGASFASIAVATAFLYALLRHNRTIGVAGLIIFAGVPAIVLWWKHVG